MCLLPQSLGDLERFNVEFLPPGELVAGLMQLTVMTAAEGNGVFIADFQPNGSGLRKAQVMRVCGLPTTDETGLRGDKLQMVLVA